jgi:SnoaL-like polyketide cyclase
MEPLVALLRRYVVDYTNRHDTSVCAEIMEPDYTLRMGSHVVAGRDDAYLPAAAAQFRQFPGLCLTVHEIVTNGERLAMRFTEHGASGRHAGAVASWRGLGLYSWNGTRLTGNYVEQDYLSRRRQLTTRTPDPVDPPALAPWDTVAVAADPAAEQVVRGWLDDGLPGTAVHQDDGTAGPILDDAHTEVDDLFSAGEQVAFRVTRRGRYRGGPGGGQQPDDTAVGAAAALHLVGLVTVTGDRVVGGRTVRDRLGLARALAAPAETRQ